MLSDYYPEIDPSWLLPVRMVVEGLRGDPLWLERSACPYDLQTREAISEFWTILRAASAPRQSTKAPRETTREGGDRWEELQQEARILYDDLRTFKEDLEGEGQSMDVKERLAYFRTAAQLLERMTQLGERATNLKAIGDFQSAVLAVFDKVLLPEQRTRALEMLQVFQKEPQT